MEIDLDALPVAFARVAGDVFGIHSAEPEPSLAMTTDANSRYWAGKTGLRCRKAWGQYHLNNQGDYQLIDSHNNVAGGRDFEFSAAQVVESVQRTYEPEVYGN
jgi:hypothetical protein